MRPLTDAVPKPLLRAGKMRLIEYHLNALREAEFSNIVINTAYKGNMIRETLGNGSRYGVRIAYSDEGSKALETGGGIRNALSLIDENLFTIVNADVWTDFPFTSLPQHLPGTAHLVMVDNPQHNQKGDFALNCGVIATRTREEPRTSLTYSGIAVMSKKLFAESSRRAFPLRELLDKHIETQSVTGTHYRGKWFDIGTPERLERLDAMLATYDSL